MREDKDTRQNSYSKHLVGAALGILVMGVSIAGISAMWLAFGHIGQGFSKRVLDAQQDRLHELYGLPQEPEISPELLEVPPSLREFASVENATSDIRNTTIAEIRPT